MASLQSYVIASLSSFCESREKWSVVDANDKSRCEDGMTQTDPDGQISEAIRLAGYSSNENLEKRVLLFCESLSEPDGHLWDQNEKSVWRSSHFEKKRGIDLGVVVRGQRQ